MGAASPAAMAASPNCSLLPALGYACSARVCLRRSQTTPDKQTQELPAHIPLNSMGAAAAAAAANAEI